MTVFKGYMTLVKRNLNMVLMYLGIFLGIAVMVQAANSKKAEDTFDTESVDIAVIKEEDSPLADGLYDYLDSMHNIVSVGAEKRDIQNALYYRYAVYVVTIPKGYQEQFFSKGEKLKTMKLPQSESAQYIDAQIDTFLNGVNVYYKSGYTVAEAVEHTLEQGKTVAKVRMIDQNGNGGRGEAYGDFLQLFPYIMIAILGMTVARVMMRFRSKEIRQRMACSSVSLFKQNMEGVLALCITSVGIWGVTMLMVLILYGSRFMASPNKWYYLANTLILTLTALSIAFLIGVLVKKETVLTSVVNTVALGMCTLCGAFVPLEILGSNVKKVSQFLPVYWYEVINGMLEQFHKLSTDMTETIWKGFGIQLAFALACLFVALAVSKMQQQENN